MPAAEIAEKENALEAYSAQACELKRLYDRIGQIRTETAEVVKARDAALARKSELLCVWASLSARRRIPKLFCGTAGPRFSGNVQIFSSISHIYQRRSADIK
jgi:hypothetical protein